MCSAVYDGGMRGPSHRVTVLTYISLAAGSVFLGTIFTYVLIIAAAYYGIDLSVNLWMLALPLVMALTLNVLFVELYHKFRKH